MRVEEWSDLRIILTIIGGGVAVMALLVFCTSCAEKVEMPIEKDQCEKEYLPMGVKVFSYHGHEYFYNYKGGVAHTESCRCRESEVAK